MTRGIRQEPRAGTAGASPRWRVGACIPQGAVLLSPSRCAKAAGGLLQVVSGLRWRSSTVEQLICNQQVAGSIPIASSSVRRVRGLSGLQCSEIIERCGPVFQRSVRKNCAGVAEWLKAADCKSAGVSLRWFESIRLHHLSCTRWGVGSVSLWKLDRVGGSNSGVESQPSKLLVAGSNPVSRSTEFVSVETCCTGPRSSVVEHVLGKDGVTSSNLVVGSSLKSLR